MWFITYANGIAWHVISLQNLKTKYLGLGSIYADVHLGGCKLYLEFGCSTSHIVKEDMNMGLIKQEMFSPHFKKTLVVYT